MKKFAFLLVLPLVVSVVTVLAQKKDGSTESAEQHVLLNPGDLKWGDVPPGLPPGGEDGGFNRRSHEKRDVYRPNAGARWLQNPTAFASDGRKYNRDFGHV